MADTKWLKDENNVKFFPRTHINSVKDDDGNTVGALLGGKVSDVKVKVGTGTAVSIVDSNKVANVVLDTTPTANSTNTVTSGGVYTAVNAKYTKPSGGIPASDLASGVIPNISTKADKNNTTAGTYKSVTVNSQGIVTAGSNPTTLSDYGITDAKIENGIITLGSNTITPLTSFTETDPVFTASAAHGISSTDISNWNGKGTYSKPSGGIPSTDLASGVTDKLLPSVSSTDNGKVLKVVSGAWEAGSAPSGGDVNIIEVVKVNGSALTPDANKAVNVEAITGVTIGSTPLTPASGVVTIGLDNTPTTNSTNLVLSGAIKSYVDGIVGDIETLLAAI